MKKKLLTQRISIKSWVFSFKRF